MIFDRLVLGIFETNCYLVGDADSRECAIIDPAADPEKIIDRIEAGRLKPKMILLTHCHFDHIGAVAALKERYKIPALLDEDDLQIIDESLEFARRFDIVIPRCEPDEPLKAGGVIEIGKYCLQVVKTPGHSPGSISFLADNEIFVGDTLFKNGVGRTDLAGGSPEDLKKSLRTIIQLDGHLKVFPGHGLETTVEEEKRHNPFLNS